LPAHPCTKSPSAIAVTVVAARAVSRAAAIAGVRTYESVPLYAVPLYWWLQRFRYSGGYSGSAIVAAIAGVRAYESVPLYADRYSGGYSGSAIVLATVVPL